MTSTDENLSTDAAPRLRRRPLTGYQNPQELERRKRAQQRLKEVYSSIPWYKEQGEKDGDLFWKTLHDSAVLRD